MQGLNIGDVVMMSKGLLIQYLYRLSDDQLKYQIEDPPSFQQFLGLSTHQSPQIPKSTRPWVLITLNCSNLCEWPLSPRRSNLRLLSGTSPMDGLSQKPVIRNLDSSMSALSQLQTKDFLLVWVES